MPSGVISKTTEACRGRTLTTITKTQIRDSQGQYLADLDSSSDDEENSSNEEQSDIFIDPAELDENGDYIAEKNFGRRSQNSRDDSGQKL